MLSLCAHCRHHYQLAKTVMSFHFVLIAKLRLEQESNNEKQLEEFIKLAILQETFLFWLYTTRKIYTDQDKI